MMLFLYSVVKNPDFHASVESSITKKALPNSGRYPILFPNNWNLESQSMDQLEILQKLEQMDSQKFEGNLQNSNPDQKIRPPPTREGELATSTSFNLRRRNTPRESYLSSGAKVKKESNKRPLPSGSLPDEVMQKGKNPL